MLSIWFNRLTTEAQATFFFHVTIIAHLSVHATEELRLVAETNHRLL